MVEQGLSLVILISGRGSNMEAIINACKDNTFPAKISCVISNNPDATGLQKASDEGIKTYAIGQNIFGSKKEFEAELLEKIKGHTPDLVCLAGFMRILSADFLSNCPCDVINIHPSLLPKFKGLDTHKRALEAGETKSGCTVHFVTPEVDEGQIVIQKEVQIDPNETEESLSSKVLVQEHIAYPEAIYLIAKKRLEKIKG